MPTLHGIESSDTGSGPLSLDLLVRQVQHDLMPPSPFFAYKDTFPFAFQVIIALIYNVGWYVACAYLFW